MVILAAVLIASGLLHVGVWAFDGGAWAGPVSWRKPIVFGLSAGLTTASLAWVIAHLPETRRSVRLARIHVVAMALEVALIDMQRWRGVASHFNSTTAFDSAVFTTMGLLILVASWPIVAWTFDLVRARDLAPDRRACLLGGMIVLDLGLLVGIGLSAWGGSGFGGADPAVIGRGGSLKLPHAIGLHALQVLPIAGLVLARWVADVELRTRWIVRLSIGYGALLIAALVQATAGLPAGQPTTAALAIIVIGVVLPWRPWASWALGLPSVEGSR
ncbi:MAG: hypothetical protein IAG13_24035 [Deltaproteobacteria bacterium]|nr:hypothetical protein [Nannocystaceae bacterium]